MSNTAVLHEAIAQLWSELPALFGDAWPAVEQRLITLLRRLEQANQTSVDNGSEFRESLLAHIQLSPTPKSLTVSLLANAFDTRQRYDNPMQTLAVGGYLNQLSADPNLIQVGRIETFVDEVAQRHDTYLAEIDEESIEDPASPVSQVFELFREAPAAELRLQETVKELLPLGPSIGAAPASHADYSQFAQYIEQVSPYGEPIEIQWSATIADALSEPPVPAGAELHVRYKTIPVLFGTTRKASSDSRPERAYSGDRGAGLHLGVANVSIPDEHKLGALEEPSYWRLEFRQDPAKHVVLLNQTRLDQAAFVERARESAAHASKREALIFVHGYRVNFATAIRQAAQVAYDLQFSGLAMAFTWPSEGRLASYTVDETNARWTEPYFREFLELCISQLGLEVVHLIAHSMGNRVLAETLGDFIGVGGNAGDARVGQVVLAAADIDAQTLKHLAPRFSRRAERFTLYASSRDKALQASQRLHRYARAGDTSDGLFIAPGIDTIDASTVDTSFVGHSYFGSDRSVISDIFALLRQGLAPDNRFGLRRQRDTAGDYWIFQP